MNKETQTPIECIDSYADYLEVLKVAKLDDGALLDLVIEVTMQEPSPEGLPTCLLYATAAADDPFHLQPVAPDLPHITKLIERR